MRRWGHLGSDEPFDPQVDPGDTGPLRQLFPKGQTEDVTGGSAEPQPFLAPARRDLLRNALLALSAFGDKSGTGGLAGKIAMQEITQRGIDERAEASEKRKDALKRATDEETRQREEAGGVELEEVSRAQRLRPLSKREIPVLINAARRAGITGVMLGKLSDDLVGATVKDSGDERITYDARGTRIVTEDIGRIREVGGNLYSQRGMTVDPTPMIPVKPPPDTPLSADQRMALANSPYKYAKTFGELASLEGGGEALRISGGPKPSETQAAYLKARKMPSNLSWEELSLQYPDAADLYFRDLATQKATESAQRVAETRSVLAGMSYAEKPEGARVPFNKATGMRDDSLNRYDVRDGKGILLDPETARAVVDINRTLPSLVRLKNVTQGLLAEKGVTNLSQALKLAVERKLATSTDVAEFDALQGVLGRQIARAIERARSSDQDAEAILKSFPTLSDTTTTGTRRLSVIVNLLTDAREAYLGKPLAPLTVKDLDFGDPALGSQRSGGKGRIQRSPLPMR